MSYAKEEDMWKRYSIRKRNGRMSKGRTSTARISRVRTKQSYETSSKVRL